MSITPQDLDLPPGARVVVAMSGGVDSSVTAAVMAAAGYEVVGITLQLYDHGVAVGKKGACCAGQDIYDAKRVAEQIGIPHYVLDYERRFKEAVMADFAESYAAGETPIPCVRCNQRVKFRDLLTTARDLGAVALATGHYVRREPGPRLLKAVEEGRDQSYFLFATTRDELDFLRFPLGGLAKDETRRLAERFNLPVAQKPDSQDICFVPTGKYAQVVERLKPGAAEEGEIVDLSGRVLGRHAGIIHFTVGQRRGLGVAGGEPLYVVKLDAQQRRVVVGPQAALATAELTLREVNWLAERADGMPVSVKVRSAQPPVGARLWLEGSGGRLVFDRPELGVAPGQAAVCYDGERVLGGGWIAKTQSAYLGEGRVA